MTEKLEAEKPVKLFNLIDDEAQKKNTDHRKKKLDIRIIIIISSCWHLVKTLCYMHCSKHFICSMLLK